MKKLIALLALTMALTLTAFAQTPAQPKKHRVVFQINTDSPDSWNQLLGNVRNAQTAFGEKDIEVEVVAYGKGINLLLKTNAAFEEGLKKAIGSGVVMAVCQNSMRARKVKVEDLFPFSTPVDSGVAELIRKQEAGFAYIRAGE